MLTKPIPVRIPTEWLPRIDAVAKKLGTNRARLIAFSGQTFAEFVERNGVTAMPPDWSTILADMDGRRRRGKSSLQEQLTKIAAAPKAGKAKPGRKAAAKSKR